MYPKWIRVEFSVLQKRSGKISDWLKIDIVSINFIFFYSYRKNNFLTLKEFL